MCPLGIGLRILNIYYVYVMPLLNVQVALYQSPAYCTRKDLLQFDKRIKQNGRNY